MNEMSTTTYTITARGRAPWATGVSRRDVLDELRAACRVAGDHDVYDDETGRLVPVEDLISEDAD